MISVHDNTTNQQFEIRQGEHLAFLTYRVREGKLYLLHTEVPEALGGQGMGSALVQHGVAYARQHGYGLVPYCVFARGYLEKHPPEAP